MMRTLLGAVKWQVVLAALVCGGIVHIAATLMVPQLAAENAVHRLFAELPVNRMRVLPPASPQTQLLPFVSPDMRLAMCRFDIGGGPIVVSALLPDKGWSLAIYTPDGNGLFAVPAQDARRAEVSFVLVPPVEQTAPGPLHLGRAGAEEARTSQITVPQREGLIVVRAAVRGEAYAKQVEAQLARARCGLRRS